MWELIRFHTDWVSDVKPMYEEYLASSKCLFVVYEDYVVQRDA